MTKAFFKDGSTERAVSYFKEKIALRQSEKQTQENFLVGLYDSVFPEGIDSNLSLEEF